MGLANTSGGMISGLIFLTLMLSGCTSNYSLLEPSTRQEGFVGNPLARPPEDAFKSAEAVPGAAQDDEEAIALSPGVPSLTELNAFVQPGIDPVKEALALEVERNNAAVNASVKWRGRMTNDGIDLVNIDGVLCSSPNRGVGKSFKVQMACSDGRLATLTVSGVEKAQVAFGNSVEKARLLTEP